MALGKKTGGRKKGTPNKRTLVKRAEIVAAYDGGGITPLAYLLSILRDTTADVQLRMDAARYAAPFVHPRLAQIEHGGSVEITNSLAARLNAARAAARARELNGGHNGLDGQLLEHEAAHARKLDGLVEVDGAVEVLVNPVAG